MAVLVNFNNSVYLVPTTGETGWSSNVTNLLSDVGANTVTLGTNQTISGAKTFTGAISLPATNDLSIHNLALAGSLNVTGATTLTSLNVTGATTLTSPLGLASGGTGASTASAARTSLGSTATGDAVFTAASASAARTAIGAQTDVGIAAASASNSGQLVQSTGTTMGYMAGTMNFRNAVHNGDAKISQRGTLTGITTNVYFNDRWRELINGATPPTMTLTQTADHPLLGAAGYCHRVQFTAAKASVAAGDQGGFYHAIEGYNIVPLIEAGAFTLSFYVRSPKTGTHCVAFRNSVSDRSYVATYSVTAANTWEKKTITVTGFNPTSIGGTWNYTTGVGMTVDFAQWAGSTFQTTAGAWQNGVFYATSAQQNLADTLNATFSVTDVQVEPGTVATPFERRHQGIEYDLCLRYFYRLKSVAGDTTASIGSIGNAYSTTSIWNNVGFLPKPMRTRPSATVSAAGHFSQYAYSGTVAQACTNVAFNTTVTMYVVNTADGASATWTAGNNTWLGFTTIGTGYIDFTADI